MENQLYVLAELEDLSSIFSPLKSTSRIKYTCFNASNNFLIFGATSGGLYVFQREPCCFLQLLPNKEGAVTQISISPNERLIAFSSIRGTTCILEKTPHGAKQIVTTAEHQNEQITCLQWNNLNNELFVGDSIGKVSIVMVSLFPTKGMFQTPSFVLMQLDSRIVQMDFNSNMLLVSTLTKCYICDTKKEIFRQVGHKLRDGEYGACIINTQANDDVQAEENKSSEISNLSHLKLLCARPGSRIWECTIDGTVISTHHFKEALAVPPRKIYFIKDSQSQDSALNSDKVISNGSCGHNEEMKSNYSEQSFNFQKLYLVASKYFFTFKSDGIYVFDPQEAIVLLWSNQITNIVDAKSASDVIYVWSGFSKMYALNLVSLEKYLIRLYFQKRYLDLAKLCAEYKSFLMAESKNQNALYILQDLDEKLKSDLIDDLKPLINIYKDTAQKKKLQNSQKLKSEIFLVGKNVQFLLEDKRLFSQQYLRPNYLSLKMRSHSVSPDRVQKKSLMSVGKHGSTSSLPNLMDKDNTLNGFVHEEHSSEKSLNEIQGKAEKVLNILHTIKNSGKEPPKSLIFKLFDNILELEEYENMEAILPVSFDIYFKEPDINLIADNFHWALNNKTALDWLCKPFFVIGLSTDAIERYPSILKSNHPFESLELDYKMSKLLKLFSNVLRETGIIEIIRKILGICYYRSMVEVLCHFERTSLSSVSDSTLDLENASTLPQFLNIVYFLIKVGQIDKCSKHSEKVNLNDLFYLILRFEENSKTSGKPPEVVELQCQTLFVTYLDRRPRENRSLENSNDVINEYLIGCLESINSAANSAKVENCICGFPKSLLPSTITMFAEIGLELLKTIWLTNTGKCLEICRRVNFLWKYLIRLRKSEPLESVLPLILHCGEIEELENRCFEIRDDILDLCMTQLIKLKKGICLNCHEEMGPDGETVSWTDFGMLVIKLTNPEKTLALFTKYSCDISSNELSQSFFQSLIYSAILEKRKPGLRKNLLNFLSRKNKCDSPKMALTSESVKREIFGDRPEFSGLEKEPKPNHWGVKVNFKDSCLVCKLPLDTKALIVETGLIAFKCSHTFHSACLKKNKPKCPVCKGEN